MRLGSISAGARPEASVAVVRLSRTCLAAALLVPGAAMARRRPGGAATADRPCRRDQDLTGYWVSVVAEHWHLRMLGSAEGQRRDAPGQRRSAPRDEHVGPGQGRSEPAKRAGRMARRRSCASRARLHVTWTDDNTLKIDADAGSQNAAAALSGGCGRVGRVGRVRPLVRRRAGRDTLRPPGAGPRGWVRTRTLVTCAWSPTVSDPATCARTGFRTARTRRSRNSTTRFTEPNGDSWLVIDSIVTDPTYLTQPYVSSVAFKKQRDASGWDPDAVPDRPAAMTSQMT